MTDVRVFRGTVSVQCRSLLLANNLSELQRYSFILEKFVGACSSVFYTSGLTIEIDTLE